MVKKQNLSPEDKMLKAIFGDKYKTDAEIDAEIESAICDISDDEE